MNFERNVLSELHLLKKTTAMNIKFRIGKRERERVLDGTNERTTVEKTYNYHIYTENIIKKFYIKHYKRNV